MFGIFRKKKASNSLKGVLDGGNADYANFVRDLIEGMDNATKAHVLIAYLNLIPIIGAMHNPAKKQETAFSIDDFILHCADKQNAAKDEINTRRYAWFMLAALIYRLVRMASRDAGLEEALGKIWCDIARCTPFLKALLPSNIVWKKEEKEWFSGIIQEPEPVMVAWAINHAGPKTVWNTSAVKQLATDFGLSYFENAKTMGPVSYIRPSSEADR